MGDGVIRISPMQFFRKEIMRNNPDDLANQCIEKIINWLNSNIDKENYNDYPKAQEILAQDSADLKEKIELFMEGVDEF